MNLSEFLASLGLDAYIEAFEAMGVTVEELPQLSAQTLKAEFGMSLVDRKRLLDAVAARGAAEVAAEAARVQEARREAEEAARVQRAREEAAETERKAAAAAARAAKDEEARKAKREAERERAEEAERAAHAKAEAAKRKADAARKAREAAERQAEEEAVRAKAQDAAIRASRRTYTARTERTREVVDSDGFLGFGRRTRTEKDVVEASFDMVELPGGTCVLGSPVDEPGRAVSMRFGRVGARITREDGFLVRPTGSLRGVEESLIPPQRCRSEARRRVRVAPFAIGVVPVTQTLLRFVDPTLENHWATGLDASDHPADTIDPELARKICNALSVAVGLAPAYTAKGEAVAGAKGFRIPTEAEWVYAARAGHDHRFAGSDDIDAVAWHLGNAPDATRPVAGKAANAWGLHDMSGNVWELTEAAPDPLAEVVTYDEGGEKPYPEKSFRDVAEEVVLDGRDVATRVRRASSRAWEPALDVPEVAWAAWERLFVLEDAKGASNEVRTHELADRRSEKKAKVWWVPTPSPVPQSMRDAHPDVDMPKELPRILRAEPLANLPKLDALLKAGPPAPLAERPDALQRVPGTYAYHGGAAGHDATYARIASSLELWRPDLPRGLRLVRSL